MFLECRGSGAPTVVLIAGGFEAGWIWTYALAPDDPVHDAPGDAFSAGGGQPRKLGTAVFPTVAEFTRVCLYDRPNTTLGDDVAGERGGFVSTPVAQPHRLEDDVADLHALLQTAGEPGPYVLVAHSYGGMIAELFARRYPAELAGEVLVDVTSVYLRETLTPEEYAELVASVRTPPPGGEALDLADAAASILAAPAAPRVPAVLFTSDKLDTAAAPSRRAELLAAHDRLAAQLGARHVTGPASGHHIHVERPQLVSAAIREVVDTVRDEAAAAGLGAAVPSLEAALDAAFARSGLPGLAVGLWVPGGASWVATRGVADRATGRPMTADLQAPIGSVTKTFTTLLALQLAGEGRLGLEDTVDRWFPDLPDAASITISMLMSHSSGFADISQVQLDVRCQDPRRDVSPDELIAMGVALPRADFTPGGGYQYSSVNTIILGRILEEITGQSYGALLQAQLLMPLGLKRTRLNSDGVLEAPYAHGYTDFCPNLPPLTDTSNWAMAAFSAGALASTLDDLHAWGVALGEGFGLTPELNQRRLDEELGMGVQRDERSGRVISFGHAGSEPGYGANVQYYPCTGAVWALMVNGDGGTSQPMIDVLQALNRLIQPIADHAAACSR
jgi:D-alanyl-D-alanine carboxypeptidase